MPRDGSGNYSRTNGVHTGTTAWAQDAAAGTNILSTRHDTHDQDIAAALTASIAADGQTPITANLPMSGFKHLNVADGTARTHYASVGQVQDSLNTFDDISSGAANTYEITLSPAITSYHIGQIFTFIAHQTNTSSATLNVNGVGAVALQATPFYLSGLIGGEIVQGEPVQVVYDSGSGGRFIILGSKTRLTNLFYFNGSTVLGTSPDAPWNLAGNSLLTTSFLCPYPFYVTGLSLSMSAPVTAGSLTATVYKGGASTAATLTISSGIRATGKTTVVSFGPTDTVGVSVSSSSLSGPASGLAIVWGRF